MATETTTSTKPNKTPLSWQRIQILASTLIKKVAQYCNLNFYWDGYGRLQRVWVRKRKKNL
jgi:hypothetical protein